MASVDKYLVLRPDGSMEWLATSRENLRAAFREAIGCDDLEYVSLPFGFGCVVDECGKVKPAPQPVNPLASIFYPGSFQGDPLAGPVVFCRIGMYQGDLAWGPLTAHDRLIIELVTGQFLPK